MFSGLIISFQFISYCNNPAHLPTGLHLRVRH